METSLLKYLLPEGILTYFEITKVEEQKETLHIYLSEQNKIPKAYKDDICHSKGFSPEITIEDFPLRGKSVLLHIKKRKWMRIKDKKVFTRDWKLVASGTRITKEFADFLKGIH